MIDSHCHIQCDDYPDGVKTLDEARKANVTDVLVVGVDIKTSKEALEFAKENEHVYAVIGIHPHETKKDGDKILNKDLILKIRADVKTILSAERTALNYLQRMSGIATYTKKMIEALDDKNICLLDTRKTVPNMRIFEKYAVVAGGGYNHRYNLSDAIMLKDNHIDAAGSITEAIKLAREYSPFIKKIEIEVEDLKGVEEAVKAGADIIMLDNMDIETTKKAIKIINKKAIIECSGNIDITNINRFKGLEIDYVSSGAITHSAKILDLSLKNLRYIE